MGFLVGLDLGQAQDYSAVVVLEQVRTPPARPVYEARLVHRWELGTPYPSIVRSVCGLLARPPLPGVSDLLVDATGVGRAVVDSLRGAGLGLWSVTLHAGHTVSHVGMNWHVPKRDLCAATLLLLQESRLRFAQDLPYTPTLVEELLNFRVTLDPRTAHDSYAAWRERDHDDLVLATALACWWGEQLASHRVPAVDLARSWAYQSQAAHRAALDRATSTRLARQWSLDPDASATAENWDQQKTAAYLRGDAPQSPYGPERL